MIRFSNGHELTFACGSGALGFDGRGWWWEQPLRWLGILDPKAFTVVAKTVTLEPKQGNLSMLHPWTCVRVVRDDLGRIGATNAIGLTNSGIDHWVKYDHPVAIHKGYQIAASVKPNNPQEAALMAEKLTGLKLAYVEVNVSCPNVSDIPQEIPEILQELQKAGHPLVLKLFHDFTEAFIRKTEPFVEAFHAINTIPWDQVFPAQVSPIESYAHKQKGGVSGDYIHIRALACVRRLSELTSRPVIGGGGIFNLSHVRNFEHNGAKAFSIGTCFLVSPWKPNQIVKQYFKAGTGR